MTLFFMIEPLCADTHWLKQITKGMKFECAQNGFVLMETNVEELKSVADIAKQENTRPIIMLYGSSMSWYREQTRLVKKAGIDVVLAIPDTYAPVFNTSCVSLDITQAIFSLRDYFAYYGHEKTALFGCNPNSISDTTLQKAFFKYNDEYPVGVKNDVVYNEGSLKKCCDTFYARIDSFDSVICCNDLCAVRLVTYLRKKKVRLPERVWIAGFGESVLGEHTAPGITSVSLENYSIGRNAVKLCMQLAKNPALTSLSACISGVITSRESTGSMPVADCGVPFVPDMDDLAKVDFYSDAEVVELLALEELVSRCDKLDFAILKGLFLGKRYHELSELLFASENTIKYRVRRMTTLAHCDNREQLVNAVAKYIEPSSL